MRLARIVDVSAQLAATNKRSEKLALLADALRGLDDDELPIGVAYLSGEPRQPRLDLGPAAVLGIEVDAADGSSLTLAEVDEQLQRIADVPSGTGSRNRRLELLRQLLARTTDEEQRWVRALVLRELRQGALEGVLIGAIARAFAVPEPAVRRAVMLSGDLRATAELAAAGGERALNELHLEVGVGIRPMLASPAEDVISAMDGLDEVAADVKLDGARVQVHRAGDAIRVFTRTLHDVTQRVPEVVATVRALDVTSVVLDGEAIAFDEQGRPRPFQETMQRFGRERPVEEVAAEVPLAVRFFDVLHHDGRDLIDAPLRDRLTVLDALLPDDHRIGRVTTSDVEVVASFLRDALTAGHEGVMVKDLDAPYEAGRRGASWRKIKPVHILDLVVLAAEWGSGRRRGWLSNLHLGARDGDRFVMLGKTFKGLTDETLTWQTEALLQRETRREGHVVHVRPELVVEIAFDGLVRSPRYPGGLALRFARVRGYRSDKSAAEADTLADVRAIHSGERCCRGTS